MCKSAAIWNVYAYVSNRAFVVQMIVSLKILYDKELLLVRSEDRYFFISLSHNLLVQRDKLKFSAEMQMIKLYHVIVCH